MLQIPHPMRLQFSFSHIMVIRLNCRNIKGKNYPSCFFLYQPAHRIFHLLPS